MKRSEFIANALTFLGIRSSQAVEMPAEIKAGEKAPNFTLTSADDNPVSLSDYEGQNIVLMFSRAHW